MINDFAQPMIDIQKSLNSLTHVLNDKKFFAALDLSNQIDKDNKRLKEYITNAIEMKRE